MIDSILRHIRKEKHVEENTFGKKSFEEKEFKGGRSGEETPESEKTRPDRIRLNCGNYTAFGISKENFSSIKPEKIDKNICFVDGGSAEVVKAPNFAVFFIRVAANIVNCRSNKTIKTAKEEFYCLARTALCGSRLCYAAEFFSHHSTLPAKDTMLPAKDDLMVFFSGKTRTGDENAADISKICDTARRFAELKMAAFMINENNEMNIDCGNGKNINGSRVNANCGNGMNINGSRVNANCGNGMNINGSSGMNADCGNVGNLNGGNWMNSGDVMVLDGSLKENYANEQKYLNQLFCAGERKCVLVCGLSKTTAMLTEKGDSIVNAILNANDSRSNGNDAWFYHPVADISDDKYRADIVFAKLNKNSNYIFKLEIYKKQSNMADKGRLISMLAENSRDYVFPGYPYGLVKADGLARVGNKEKEMLKVKLMAMSGKNFAGIRQCMNAVNAHDVLDAIK